MSVKKLKLGKKLLIFFIIVYLSNILYINLRLDFINPYLMKIIRVIIILLIPGSYISFYLGRKFGARIDEVLILNSLIGVSILTIFNVYLVYLFHSISDLILNIALLGFTIVSSLYVGFDVFDTESTFSASFLKKHLLNLILFYVVFLIGYGVIGSFLPPEYWSGYDPWVYKPIAKSIIYECLAPNELIIKFNDKINASISGFFYCLAALKVFTNISFYSITRIGGPLMAGMATTLTYFITRRIEGTATGFTAALFLLLSPYFVNRFSMPLRENFAFIFLIAILWLIIIRENSEPDLKSRSLYLTSNSLFLGLIFMSHSLTLIIVSLLVVFVGIHNIHKKNYSKLIENIFIFFVSSLISLPILYTQIFIALLYINTAKLFNLYIITMSLVGIIIIYYIYKKYSSHALINHDKYILILIFSLYLSSLYVVRNTQYEYITHTYMDSHKFSVISLFFSTLCIILIQKKINTIIKTFLLAILVTINLIFLNIPIPIFRISLYLNVVLSIISAIFLKQIFELQLNKFLDVSLTINVKDIMKFSGLIINHYFRTSSIILLIILLVSSPFTYYDYQILAKTSINSRYDYNDIASAKRFLNQTEQGELYLLGAWTDPILLFFNLDPQQIAGMQERQIYFEISGLGNLTETISNTYPNVTRVIYFRIRKALLYEDPLPMLTIFKEHGIDRSDSNSEFYILDISEMK